jgi:hypothetical protein
MVNQPNTFTVLRDFILSRMRMSHIYQPVMLRMLLAQSPLSSSPETRAGLSTIRRSPKACRVRCWPRHGLVERDRNRIVLNPISVS